MAVMQPPQYPAPDHGVRAGNIPPEGLYYPAPERGRDSASTLRRMIEEHSAATDARYADVYSHQEASRKASMERLKNRGKGIADFALKTTAVGLGVMAGYGIAEGKTLPNVVDDVKAAGKDVGDFLRGGGDGGDKLKEIAESLPTHESAPGVFDFPSPGDNPNLVSEEGPVYKFARWFLEKTGYSAADAAEKAESVTEAVGTPFISLFGRGILNKTEAFANVAAGAWLPLAAIPVGIWGLTKAAKFLRNRYNQSTPGQIRQIDKERKEQLKTLQNQLIADRDATGALRVEQEIRNTGARRREIKENLNRQQS